MLSGKDILGSHKRVKQMQDKKNFFAEKLLLLAVRICCAKMAKEKISKAATTGIRNSQYNIELDEFHKQIAADPRSSKSLSYIICMQKVLHELGRDNLDYEKDWNIVSAEEHEAPFERTEFLTFRDKYWPKLDAAVALDGWNSDDLNWIVGQNAINMRRTLGKMDDGAYGDYWVLKVQKAKCKGFGDGVRYHDGVFALYFMFLEFQYLLLLKEARTCRIHIKDLTKCPKQELTIFGQIVEYYNSLPTEHALPRVDCLDDIFHGRQTDCVELEW